MWVTRRNWFATRCNGEWNRLEAEPPAIHINAKKQDGECVFSVRDNGIGIESDKLTEIFKPFERLHSADDFEGSGIG